MIETTSSSLILCSASSLKLNLLELSDPASIKLSKVRILLFNFELSTSSIQIICFILSNFGKIFSMVDSNFELTKTTEDSE